ncbi:MAG: glycosyltransferase family 4 protein, partial [Candidatus Firestonebacteria bacterium]|nr:glycosyltransferase family 4 protein [Candidatus Firestonebacteria bacterium]
GPALWTPLARLLGMRIVVTHHGPDYERTKWGVLAKTMLRLGERWGVKFAHEVITIAPNIAAKLEARFHRRVKVIPNGVDLPKARSTQAALKKYGLTSQKYFLAVGRYVPEKNFCDLIEAYQHLMASPGGRRLAGWKLVIAGRADHESAYSRRIQEMAAAVPGVVLTGFITGPPLEELYHHAGLFVLPSSYEGLPLVLLEALSYGLPCVMSDIPANRAVKIGLENERYFSPGDIAGLTRRLAQWAKPTTARQRQLWRSHLLEHYAWRKIAAQTLAVYKGILE